jgi:hypothetical protein
MASTMSTNLTAAVRRLMAEHPNLGPFGWRDTPSPFTPTSDFINQVAAAADYISLRGLPLRCGSYALQHLVEEHKRMYVSNGALIVAALLAGYRPVRYGSGPNCRFEAPVAQAAA